MSKECPKLAVTCQLSKSQTVGLWMILMTDSSGWCVHGDMELYTWDENYGIFAVKNLKLTVHVRWQENCEILQLKIISAHNSHSNSHAVELMTFNWNRVKISLAFVFIIAFVTHDFYGKEKIVKHTQIYSWI